MTVNAAIARIAAEVERERREAETRYSAMLAERDRYANQWREAVREIQRLQAEPSPAPPPAESDLDLVRRALRDDEFVTWKVENRHCPLELGVGIEELLAFARVRLAEQDQPDSNDETREDRALDALIVAAMRGIDPEELKAAIDARDPLASVVTVASAEACTWPLSITAGDGAGEGK